MLKKVHLTVSIGDFIISICYVDMLMYFNIFGDENIITALQEENRKEDKDVHNPQTPTFHSEEKKCHQSSENKDNEQHGWKMDDMEPTSPSEKENEQEQDLESPNARQMNGTRYIVRNKDNVKMNKHDENEEVNVFLLTFTPEALPRYTYHREMIKGLQRYLNVSILDDRTPERGQVVVVCKGEAELTVINHFISDELTDDWQSILLDQGSDMVDCIVLSESLQGHVMQIDRTLRPHLSRQPRRNVPLYVLTLGIQRQTCCLPDDSQNLRYIPVPVETVPIRQLVSSILESRFLERFNSLKDEQYPMQGKKIKKLSKLMREMKDIEQSLTHYSVLKSVSQNENKGIPAEVMAVIDKYGENIQSYGIRKEVIRIRVKKEHFQDVYDDIKSTGINVDIRSVDDCKNRIVPFVKQGNRLIRTDEKSGTLGTFANYRRNGGERKQVAITCAHVCSRGNEVSVNLYNNQIERFGICIDDTCSQGGEQPEHSDLSVIQIQTNMHQYCERLHFYRTENNEINETDNVMVCQDISTVPPGKVHKCGSTTGWTHGEIMGYNNVEGMDKRYRTYFLVNSRIKSSRFAEEGDSGAVVSKQYFDEFNRLRVFYLGLVTAGNKDKEKLVRPSTRNLHTPRQNEDTMPDRVSTRHVVTQTSDEARFSRSSSVSHLGHTTDRDIEGSIRVGEYTERAETRRSESNFRLATHLGEDGNSEISSLNEDESFGLRTVEGPLENNVNSREAERHSSTNTSRGAEGYTEPDDILPHTEGASQQPAENDDNTSSSSLDSSNDIYCTSFSDNLQSLAGSISLDLR